MFTTFAFFRVEEENGVVFLEKLSRVRCVRTEASRCGVARNPTLLHTRMNDDSCYPTELDETRGLDLNIRVSDEGGACVMFTFNRIHRFKSIGILCIEGWVMKNKLSYVSFIGQSTLCIDTFCLCNIG